MIQAVNSTNFNNISKNQSFGKHQRHVDQDFDNNEYIQQPKKRPNKALMLMGYIGTQFAAGAIVQGIFDGMINAYRAIRKTQPLTPLKEIAQRSAFTGGCFALIGLVFTGIGALVAQRHKNS